MDKNKTVSRTEMQTTHISGSLEKMFVFLKLMFRGKQLLNNPTEDLSSLACLWLSSALGNPTSDRDNLRCLGLQDAQPVKTNKLCVFGTILQSTTAWDWDIYT